jgi:hypothetical protein
MKRFTSNPLDDLSFSAEIRRYDEYGFSAFTRQTDKVIPWLKVMYREVDFEKKEEKEEKAQMELQVSGLIPASILAAVSSEWVVASSVKNEAGYRVVLRGEVKQLPNLLGNKFIMASVNGVAL